jgi:hypothetical protein
MPNETDTTAKVGQARGLATEPTVVFKRRYRITADVCVEIHDITPEDVRSNMSRAANYEDIISKDWLWEQARHCRELLLALSAKPEALNGFARQEVLAEVKSGSEAINALGDSHEFDERELIRCVLDRLSPAAQGHFTAALHEEYWTEALHHLTCATRTRVEHVSLVELSD